MLRFTAVYHARAPSCPPGETPPSADKQNKTHFCIYYILHSKHAHYTTYSSYRSKTVVKKMLYATICRDSPPTRRIRSPAEAPAVADEKYTNHKNQSFLTDLFCPVLPRFTAIFCRHTGDSFCHENRPKMQNPAKCGKSGT